MSMLVLYSTGRGGAQLDEQMSAIDVPSMRIPTFCILERKLGTVLEKAVRTDISWRRGKAFSHSMR